LTPPRRPSQAPPLTGPRRSSPFTLHPSPFTLSQSYCTFQSWRNRTYIALLRYFRVFFPSFLFSPAASSQQQPQPGVTRWLLSQHPLQAAHPPSGLPFPQLSGLFLFFFSFPSRRLEFFLLIFIIENWVANQFTTHHPVNGVLTPRDSEGSNRPGAGEGPADCSLAGREGVFTPGRWGGGGRGPRHH